MIKKIDHINVVVRDIAAAKDFFTNLGFVVARGGVLEGAWIDNLTSLRDVRAEYVGMALPGDSVVLELIKFYTHEGQRDERISQLNQIGFRHMAFQVKDIEAVTAKLRAKRVTFLSPVQTYEAFNKKLCYLLGPEGIILELSEYMKR